MPSRYLRRWGSWLADRLAAGSVGTLLRRPGLSLLRMTLEAINNYLHMVSGLSKTTRARARAAAKAMLAQAGLDGVAADAGERVGKLAEEIMNAGRANRELLEKVVAGEVDKAAARLGFARTSELETLRQEVAELRRAVADQQPAGNGATAQPAPATVAAARTPRKAGVRKPTTSTAAAKKAAGAAATPSAAPQKAAARKAPARQAATKSTRAGSARSESVAKGGEDVGE
jgi:polyhydroxyalkanoate synthesis regulator phasin